MSSLHVSLSCARDLKAAKSLPDASCVGTVVVFWLVDRSSSGVVFRYTVYLFRSWLSIVGSDVGVRP